MEKRILPGLSRNMVLLLALLITQKIIAQPDRYTISKDPKNAKRSIIQIKAINHKPALIVQKTNALDISNFKRPALPFKAFEMKSPRSGAILDPNKVVKLKMPDGKVRQTTVKKYYEELNAMEKELAARGRTLRVPSTFVDLKPQTNRVAYNKIPKLSPGFKTTTFRIHARKSVIPNMSNTNTGNNLRPTTNTGNIRTIPGTGKTSGNTGTANSNNDFDIKPFVNPGQATSINFKSTLYISARFTDHGSPEFPAEWVKSTWTNSGRTLFPIIVQVPKGVAGIVTRIDWQVSEKPFSGTLKDITVSGVKKTGTMKPVEWRNFFRGTNDLPKNQDYKYAALYIDMTQVRELPEGNNIPYYIRTICYNQANEIVSFSSQVIANYGHIEQVFKIAVPETHSVPGFNYQFPEAGVNLPFGVFVRGSGLNSKKATAYLDKKFDPLVTTGYKITANAGLGIKYFNFLSIVDPNEPMAKDLTIIDGTFSVVLGLGTGINNTNEDIGAKLRLKLLDGLVPPLEIGLSQPVPNIPNSISLEYDVIEKIDIGLLDMRFMIGPVPVRIAAGITGEAGLKLFGQANTETFQITGGVKPFITTQFHASGGVDAVIAYATLNAGLDPLLSIDMPLTFTSGAEKPLAFTTNIAGLAGRIYLAVGFWYPCPDLKKIVGWLTGDEDTPLCECKWEYNIFDFPGFSHSYSY